jgi:hypothetical protein
LYFDIWGGVLGRNIDLNPYLDSNVMLIQKASANWQSQKVKLQVKTVKFSLRF